MVVTSSPNPGEGLLWYTRARRIPRLVGKLPGSERGLPFGPYTITQVVGAGITFVVLTNTTKAWGKFGFLGNLAVQAGVTFAVALALRLVKPGGRDPLTAALAVLSVWSHPRFGRRRPRRAVAVRACARVLIPAGIPPEAATPARLLHSVPAVSVGGAFRADTSPSAAPVTNLQRLRAGAA